MSECNNIEENVNTESIFGHYMKIKTLNFVETFFLVLWQTMMQKLWEIHRTVHSVFRHSFIIQKHDSKTLKALWLNMWCRVWTLTRISGPSGVSSVFPTGSSLHIRKFPELCASLRKKQQHLSSILKSSLNLHMLERKSSALSYQISLHSGLLVITQAWTDTHLSTRTGGQAERKAIRFYTCTDLMVCEQCISDNPAFSWNSDNTYQMYNINYNYTYT